MIYPIPIIYTCLQNNHTVTLYGYISNNFRIFFLNLYSDLGNNAQKCVFFRIIMSNKLYFNRKPDNLINCVNKANKLNGDGKLLQLTPAYIRVFCGYRRLIYLAVPCLMRDCTCYQELSKQSDIVLLFRENDIWVFISRSRVFIYTSPLTNIPM